MSKTLLRQPHSNNFLYNSSIFPIVSTWILYRLVSSPLVLYLDIKILIKESEHRVTHKIENHGIEINEIIFNVKTALKEFDSVKEM